MSPYLATASRSGTQQSEQLNPASFFYFFLFSCLLLDCMLVCCFSLFVSILLVVRDVWLVGMGKLAKMWHVNSLLVLMACLSTCVHKQKEKKEWRQTDKEACRVVCCRCSSEVREVLFPRVLSRSKDEKENKKGRSRACVQVCASPHFAQCALSTLSRANERVRVEKKKGRHHHSHSSITVTTRLSSVATR